MKKRVAVLGATGSIGKSTLDILRSKKEFFEPVLFSSHKNYEELVKLKREFPKAITALAGDEKSPQTADNSRQPEIDFYGKQALHDAIAAAEADITVNGISGAAGLEPSLAVLESGSDLALANKETIVMAGSIVMALAREKKLSIIPVDSEHYAIFRLLEAHGRDRVSEIILTASGGPFRNYSMEQLKNVSAKDALAHPTWNMGPKITVDSASMANKGLEIIEAAGLFGLAPEKIKVTVHPQSIVHSMVRLADGSVYAQMSKPDMKLPICGALNWPETECTAFGLLDFDSLHLDFEKPDFAKFPMLSLAYKALSGGNCLSIAYNASNEIAVEAFFNGKTGFLEIPRIVEYVITQDWPLTEGCMTIEAVLDIDRKAREIAENYIHGGSMRC